MSDIPTELHVEILKLLPAHHLFPLRLVCKDWRSFIDALVDPPSLLILPSPPLDYTPSLIHPACKKPQTASKIYSLPLHSLDTSSDNTTEELNDGIISLSSIINIIRVPEFPLPTCDGLILIPSSPEKDWTLSFHGITTVHSIPPYDPFAPHEYEPNNRKKLYTAYFGLGYDASTSDYKVVRVSRILGANQSDENFFRDAKLVGANQSDPYLFRTSIYSLKSKSWRMIQNFPRVNTPGFHSFHANSFPPGGVCMRGALHWIAGVDYIENIPEDDLVGNKYSIVALDLSSESYRKLPLPQSVLVSPSMTKYLDVLGGHLFLSCSDPDLKSVWILKDYGGENNWTKLASFQPEHSEDFDNTLMRPVAYVKSKEHVIFHYDRNKLMWVDVEKGELLKKVIVKGFEEHGFTCQGMHAILASLNGTSHGGEESIALDIMTVNKRKRAEVKFEISVYNRPKRWTMLVSNFTSTSLDGLLQLKPTLGGANTYWTMLDPTHPSLIGLFISIVICLLFTSTMLCLVFW